MGEQYENLDAIDRQAKVIADLKVIRFQLLRDQILGEIARRQNNPELSAQRIAQFMHKNPDVFEPPSVDIKVFERF